MEPDRIDGRQPARFARFVDRVLEPRHLHFVLQLHPHPRTFAGVRLVRQPDFDVAAARAQRRGAGEAGELFAGQVPARRLWRFQPHAELLDQRARDRQQCGRVAVVEREAGRVDEHEVIVRDPDVHGLDARPGLRAGVAAVREQHVGRERRLVGGVARACAELAGQPALVRQRALEVLAGHALDEARAGQQLFERGAVQRVQGRGRIGCRRQRERNEKMEASVVHDGAHCMANCARDRAGGRPDCVRRPFFRPRPGGRPSPDGAPGRGPSSPP
ncbi:conserved hypothetical protein [Burkholderia ambifaria MEX-5]|uniref:Uncharacterized protein n=1 Tax=Burkholderia ambifaria MEX-5 TaxID=396597 RepID=B1TED3_9BURK|nr:conserved hypothetical protein [Burkholderia ambifaria MEX-5]